MEDATFQSLPLQSFHEELIRFLAGSTPLEQKLLSAFPPSEFPLKMLRGLPRLYDKEDPRKVRFKEGFSHLPSLKKAVLEKFLLPLYEKKEIPERTQLVLINYILADGWGDFIAAKESVRILKSQFPQLVIDWIAIAPKWLNLPKDPNIRFFLEYETEFPASSFPEEAIELIRQSDLILSLPTLYPDEEGLKARVQKKQIFSIGQYGFAEAPGFQPESNNRAMGLHFLEKGIILPSPINTPSFRDISHPVLLNTLFHSSLPSLADIESYLQSHHFYFAYLLTPEGGATYLHALLEMESASSFDIDICTPNLQWLLDWIDLQNKKGKACLEKSFGVGRIEIHDRGQIHAHQLQETGKTLRILFPGKIEDPDFQKLIALSENFVAVRGDQSFSQAIVQNRIFFYDGAPHARSFIKDLVALAENRIPQYKSALQIFRAMRHLYASKKINRQWVDELFFTPAKPWQLLAREIAKSLQDPNTKEGFSTLSRLIQKEYSFHSTLCQIIQRMMTHALHPDIADFETQQIQAFCEGRISAKECLMAIFSKL